MKAGGHNYITGTKDTYENGVAITYTGVVAFHCAADRRTRWAASRR